MSSINSVSPANDVLNQYSLDKTSTTNPQGLGKNEFMDLMVAQMNNQSPLDPQDNGAFISQLAQFSSLEEMQKMSSTVNGLSGSFQSTQALQASAMVGRSVLVPSAEINLGADAQVSGMVDLPLSTGGLNISILNASGELINKISLGQQSAGQVPFSWDGMNSSGQLMPPGKYSIKAEAGVGSASQQVGTLLSANVDSVSVSQSGSLTLNVAGVGAMPLDQVRQIK